MIYLLIIDKYILLLMRKGVSRIIRPIGSASDNENGKFFKIRKTIEFSYIFNNEFFFLISIFIGRSSWHLILKEKVIKQS